MDTKPVKSLISVSQIVEKPWNFTFAAAIDWKVLVLRIGVWTIQDMLEKADDEIFSNLQKFYSEKKSKYFFGDEVH